MYHQPNMCIKNNIPESINNYSNVLIPPILPNEIKKVQTSSNIINSNIQHSRLLNDQRNALNQTETITKFIPPRETKNVINQYALYKRNITQSQIEPKTINNGTLSTSQGGNRNYNIQETSFNQRQNKSDQTSQGGFNPQDCFFKAHQSSPRYISQETFTNEPKMSGGQGDVFNLPFQGFLNNQNDMGRTHSQGVFNLSSKIKVDSKEKSVDIQQDLFNELAKGSFNAQDRTFKESIKPLNLEDMFNYSTQRSYKDEEIPVKQMSGWKDNVQNSHYQLSVNNQPNSFKDSVTQATFEDIVNQPSQRFYNNEQNSTNQTPRYKNNVGSFNSSSKSSKDLNARNAFNDQTQRFYGKKEITPNQMSKISNNVQNTSEQLTRETFITQKDTVMPNLKQKTFNQSVQQDDNQLIISSHPRSINRQNSTERVMSTKSLNIKQESYNNSSEKALVNKQSKSNRETEIYGDSHKDKLESSRKVLPSLSSFEESLNLRSGCQETTPWCLQQPDNFWVYNDQEEINNSKYNTVSLIESEGNSSKKYNPYEIIIPRRLIDDMIPFKDLSNIPIIKNLPNIDAFDEGIKELKNGIPDGNMGMRSEVYSYNIVMGPDGKTKYKADYKIKPQDGKIRSISQSNMNEDVDYREGNRSAFCSASGRTEREIMLSSTTRWMLGDANSVKKNKYIGGSDIYSDEDETDTTYNQTDNNRKEYFTGMNDKNIIHPFSQFDSMINKMLGY